MVEFTPFPKIPRLRRDCVITEKIDGTNAAVVIVEGSHTDPYAIASLFTRGQFYTLYAQSRKRFITPNSDNFGFAKWVYDNAEDLCLLGPGTHFGEWWGQGIQRGYGLSEKRFSLFNTARWGDIDLRPGSCGVVPTIHEGLFSDRNIALSLSRLYWDGSWAAPGYDRPEGIVVFHKASGHIFKVLLENDEIPKGVAGV